MLALAYFLKTTPCCFNKTFSAQAKALAVFGLAFGLGAGLALFASPSSPHNYPALQKTLLEYKKAIPLTATVAQVDSMPDARLRIILQDVEIQLSPDFTDNFADNFAGNDFVKLEAEANKSKKAKSQKQTQQAQQNQQTQQNWAEKSSPHPITLKLSNNLAWTWKFPTSLPLPGQRIAISLRISPVHGMFNPGVFSIEDYWAEKDVAWRAWSEGEKGNYQILTPAPFWQEARAKIHARLSSILQNAEGNISKGKAVILALLMGDRYYLTNYDMDLFAAASLSHSLALSGLHLGLMVALGTALAFLLCRLCPSIMLYLPRPKLVVLFSTPLVLIYLWLGGITPSLSRAALMFACWGVLLLRGRQHVLMDGLFWAILLLLIINPLALHDIRLQLSAISVAAIALCLPVSVHWAKKICKRRGWLGKILRGGICLLIISTSIQLALLPIQVENFGQATPWFVLNLIWLPVLSTFVFPLAVLGLLLCLIPGLEIAARWILDLAALPIDLLFSLLSKLDKLDLLVAPAVARPLPAASLAYWALFLLFVAMLSKHVKHKQNPALNATKEALKPTPPKLKTGNSFLLSLKTDWAQAIPLYANTPKLSFAMFGLLFCAWGLIAFCLLERWQGENPASLRLRLLDVGQGQAVLIEGAHGARILIDGGGFPGSSFDVGKNIIAPVLTLNRAPRLNAAINTHPDHDHLGGMVYLFNKFEIEHIYLGQGLPQGKKGEELKLLLEKKGFKADLNAPPLRAGQYLALDNKHGLQVIYPKNLGPESENNKPKAAKEINANQALDKDQDKDKDKNINDQSLILRLVLNASEKNQTQGLALNCADVYLSGIDEMLAANPNQLNSQILILPHHGSQKSFTPKLYDAVNPDFALASTGFNNPWGFPSQQVRGELRLRQVPLYNTAELGQIVVEWNKEYQAKLSWAWQ